MLKPAILTNYEATAVLSTAHTLGPADEVLAQLAITAGLRLHEIADLDANDITLEHETDHLDNDGTEPDSDTADLHDENNPPYLLRIGFGKTPRTIPVAQPANRALHTWMADRPDAAPLLPGASTPEQIASRWKHVLLKAGVHRAEGEGSVLEAGRNRLLKYLLGLEERGALPYGYAAAYLGLPGTGLRELPSRWYHDVIRAIADQPLGQNAGAPAEEE
ncbi:hypothetical protein [Streptomyces sp. FH025]|uniref:hypothetical protein n=1 Tax=Streptomyces sp. FH025 TaxID=2815937 RepID=UPI001A9E176F|nr:hypothetical protein [Streptomyces sp. FH025]MBO1413073.1 hypothetical protein [Streptomyces sp. FH025]